MQVLKFGAAKLLKKLSRSTTRKFAFSSAVRSNEALGNLHAAARPGVAVVHL
jgi:hypothetical protein